jgi:hypothetical protein
LLTSSAVEKLAQRRGELESRISAVEGRKDVAALGSAQERDQWTRIQRVEAALAAAPPGDDTAELRERLRLVKGVLFFRLNDSFNARLWQQHRTMKDLDLALHEAQNRWIRVDRARRSVPTNNGEFAGRVTALKVRIDALQGRLAATEQKQSAYLAQVAVAELQQQKNRLETYQVQARFALATMYDRAANPPAPPKSGSEAQPAQPSPAAPAPRSDDGTPPAVVPQNPPPTEPKP